MTETAAAPAPGRWAPVAARLIGFASYPVAVVALLWPALINGFPLLMGDSFRYLREAGGDYQWVSSQFYGYLLRIFSGTSLWVAVVVQAVAAVAVVATFLRRVAGLPHPVAALATTLLAVTSSLPLFAGLVMTDIWFGLGLIAATVLLVAERSLLSDIAMMVVVAFTAAAHPAALPLLGVLLVVAVTIVVWRRLRAAAWEDAGGVGLLAVGVGVAVVALMVNNQAVWGKLSPNPHSSVVAFVYLLGHGDLEDELAGCTEWEMCRIAERPRGGIRGFNRLLFDREGFLYTELGGPEVFAPEATEIVLTHITSDPTTYLARVAGTGFAQLSRVKAFPHVRALMNRMHPGRIDEIAAFNPGDGPRFAASRVYRRTLDLGPHEVVGMVVGWLGAAATVAGAIVGLVRKRRGSPPWPRHLGRTVAGAAVLGGLYVLHGFVVGTTAYSVGRYGGRVLWLLALVFWALVFAFGGRWIGLRRAGSGRTPGPSQEAGIPI